MSIFILPNVSLWNNADCIASELDMHGSVRVCNAIQDSLGLLHEVKWKPHLWDQSLGGSSRTGICTFLLKVDFSFTFSIIARCFPVILTLDVSPGKAAWNCRFSHAIWNAWDVVILGWCRTFVFKHRLGSGCQLGISSEAYGNFISETFCTLVCEYKERGCTFRWFFGPFKNPRAMGWISDIGEMGDRRIRWAHCSFLERWEWHPLGCRIRLWK